MRNLIKSGVVLTSLATLIACGGESKPAQDPTTLSAPAPPPAPPPPPETQAPMTDTKPMDSSMNGAANAANDTTPPPAAKPVEKPLTDAEIVMVTSTANNGEIEMAELAKRNSTNGDVKNFAAMMITQHRDMENKGKALATKAKITPADNATASSLKSDVESTITTLKTQKGKDFDKAYMDSQVKAHRDVLDIFDNKLLPNAQNGELKTLLTDARSHVATHLAKAQEIDQKLESGASTVSTPATMPGKPAPKK